MLKVNNVIIVSHSLTYSGAPLVALDIADYLKNTSNITLVNMNPDDKTEQQRQVSNDIDLVHFPTWIQNPGVFMRIANKMLRFFTKEKVNLKKAWFFFLVKERKPNKIIHNTFYHVDIQSVSNFLKIPSIRYLHENFEYLKDLTTCEIKIINNGNKTIGCSPSVVDDAKKIGIRCDRDFYPASTDKQLEELNKNFSTWGMNKKNNSIVTVGSGFKRKGGKYAEHFAKKYKIGDYYWVGEIENPEQFKYVKYIGLQKKVDYTIADSYFLLSTHEPWPISVLEALAAGLVIFGWRHLAIIAELENVGLAVSVKSYDIEHLYMVYSQYDFNNHQRLRPTALEFLNKFQRKNYYKNMLKIN